MCPTAFLSLSLTLFPYLYLRGDGQQKAEVRLTAAVDEMNKKTKKMK